MKHFNPFPYLACALYASFIIIVIAGRFAPQTQPAGQVSSGKAGDVVCASFNAG